MDKYLKYKHKYLVLKGASNIKLMFNELTYDIFNEYDYENKDAIKSELFYVMLILSGYKNAMLVELYGHFYENKGEILIKNVKKIIKKYKLNNIKIKAWKKMNCYFIYNAKYTDQVTSIIDENDTLSLGKLLEFTCPDENLNKLDDRISQHIYANGYPFFIQLCSEKTQKKSKNIFDQQLAKYKKLGKLLDISITMDFRKSIGINNLLTQLNKPGIDGISSNKHEFINIIYNINSTQFTKTLKILQADDNKLLQNNEKSLKIILNMALVSIENMSFDKIEHLIY
jgi:hypothetical protein